jgi:hypothetical protein
MNRDELLRPSRKISKWPYITLGLGIIIILTGLTVWFVNKQPTGTLPYPISKSEAKRLGFDIYYPSQKLLPTGYTLDKGSFYITNQVIIYSVSYGTDHKIIFSDQAKPIYSQIQAFYTKDLPLNTTFQTSIGTATIGAINLETVVSVPTKTNAWLIATAPGDIDQNQLDQVIKALELAR